MPVPPDESRAFFEASSALSKHNLGDGSDGDGANPWIGPMPAIVEQARAQLSMSDRQAYFFAAKQFIKNGGVLIDAGTLAGGTSVALAAGALSSGIRLPERPFLHAFDQFLCDWATPEFFMGNFGGKWKSGDNFRHIYEDVVKPFAQHIVIHEVDLTSPIKWEWGEIGVLGIDVWKTPEIAFSTSCMFFPHLKPGAVVLHQDYQHIWLPWIHTMMEALSDYFDPIYYTRQGGTAVFSVKKRVSMEAIQQAIRIHDNPKDVEVLAERLLCKISNKETSAFVKLARVIYRLKHFGPEAASTMLNELTLPEFGDEMDDFFAGQRQTVADTIAYSQGR